MRAKDFLEAIGGGQAESATQLRKARISPTWDGSLKPPVIFDGESVATIRTFPFIGAKPQAGDVVLIAKFGHGWIILGKVSE